MKSTFKKLPGSQIELEVVLDQKEFLEYYQPIYDQALSAVQIKGFRPGTAPKEIAEKAVDREKVFEESANKTVRENLQEISKENDWQIIDRPQIEVLDTPDAGLKFKAVLTVFPELKLGNYRKIARQILAEKKEEKVTDEEMSQAIQWILKSRAKSEDGPSTSSGFQKEAPELTDELAKSLGKFENAEDLKKSIREGLRKEKNGKEKEKARIKILDAIREKSVFDLPKIMVDKTLSNIAAEREAMIGRKENPENLQKESRAKAEDEVKNNLILYQIAKRENLAPEQKEVEEEANRFLTQSRMTRKEAEGKIDPQRLYDYIYGIVQNKKVFEFLEKL